MIEELGLVSGTNFNNQDIINLKDKLNELICWVNDHDKLTINRFEKELVQLIKESFAIRSEIMGAAWDPNFMHVTDEQRKILMNSHATGNPIEGQTVADIASSKPKIVEYLIELIKTSEPLRNEIRKLLKETKDEQ